MTISSISSSSIQQLWQQVNSLTSASQTESTSETDLATVTTGTGVSVDLSDPGKAFSQLQQLSESDPEDFKTTMASIADQIEEAAESTSDEKQSDMLREIAADFREAAENGDMSSMQQQPPPPPPDGANGDQISAYTQNASSGSIDSVMSIVKGIVDDAISAL